MIHLQIQADNYDELKQKCFLALGLKEPAQAVLPLTIVPRQEQVVKETNPVANHIERVVSAAVENVVSPMAQMAEAAAPKKAKKAKVEPTHTEVEEKIEEAMVEEAVIEEAADLLIGKEDANLVDCQDLLREILKQKSTPAAISLLGKFGVAKLTLLNADRYAEFYLEAKKVLSHERT